MDQHKHRNDRQPALGKEHINIFLSRLKKPKRLALNLKNADQNPVYKVMKNQRETSPYLIPILKSSDNGLKRFVKEIQANCYSNDQLDFRQPYNKSRSVQQIETFKERAVKIMAGTKQVTVQLERSKKKIFILDKFNKKVEKYCSYLPESPEQEKNQSKQANDQLINLCQFNFFPTQDMHKRASSFLHYHEPHISLAKLQNIKDRAISNSVNRFSESKPIKRFLTLNV